MERTEELDFRRYRQSGDPEAMARVFDAVAPKLLLVAGHLTRDAGEAEDLVQATFLTALQDAERWDAARPLVPWLVGILSHRALDQKRRNRVRSAQELHEGAGATSALDPLELVSNQELREAIARSVDALEEPYREVLVLRVAHGLEPTEIAHTLGRSPGTVRMQLKRGREQLGRALPQGLSLPAFLLVDAGRGLAAVREVVLAKAGATVAVAAATTVSISTLTLGGLMTKALMTGAGVFGLGVILWAVFGGRSERESATPETLARGERIERAAEPLGPGGALESAETPEPAARRVAAEPVRAAPFGVRVTFEEDGSPAANVGVYVRPAQGDALGVELRTDETGLASFDELARGSYRVDLDRWDAEAVAVELSRERTVELAIPSGVDVEGLVVDPEGNPVAGAEVFRLNLGHHDYLQWTATADASGVFRLRDVAPRTEFVARAAGYQPSRAGLKGGTSVRSDVREGTESLRLVVGARGNRLTGRVVDGQGNPQPHARIALAVEEDTREDGVSRLNRNPERTKPADLELFSIRADEDGLFDTDELPAGNATYFARTVGAEPLVAVGPLEVTPGIEHRLDIVVGPGASVFGIVTDTSGEPMRGFTVRTEWRGSPVLGAPEHDLGMLLTGESAVTAEDGAFQVFGLLPGEHDVELVHPSGKTLAHERPTLARGGLFRWMPRVERLTNVVVQVLGPAGEALEGWGVGLCSYPSSLQYQRSEHEEGFAPDATDADGRYTFRNVRPRAWIVTAHAPSDGRGIPAPVALCEGVYPGGEEVIVHIPALPTGSVRGTVLDAAGAVPRRSWRSEEVAAEVALRLGEFEECGRRPLDDTGGFEFRQLPPGSYDVVLVHADDYPGDYELASLELGSGQSLDLGLLTPAEPASVEVRIVADDGDAIEDPEIVLTRKGDDEWNGRRADRDSEDPAAPLTLRALKPGSYTLVIKGRRTQDIAPHIERFELAPGELLRRMITVTRGKKQTFEVTLAPHPNEENRRPFAAPSARLEIELFDTEDHLILRERDHYELFDVGGNRLRFTLPLQPGPYRARLTDHRDPALRNPRPAAEIEFEVPATGTPDVLLVELR